jgi:hypothetical protein
MLPLLKVIVMVVWLSNSDGSTAQFSCWITSTKIDSPERGPLSGSVQL